MLQQNMQMTDKTTTTQLNC